MHKLTKLMVVMVFSALASQVYAQVGKVIIAKGDSYALDQSNETRVLQRRSSILEGDTLITGNNSEVHIRFNDNAILALRSNSQLKISEYHAQSNTQSEKVLMELLSGGFRTISGSFGKTNKDAYQIKTPNASIGIRGTNYEAVLSDGALYVGVYQGGISLSNDQGNINLGLDSDFSYANVMTPNSKIQGQVNPPAALTNALTTAVGSNGIDTQDEETSSNNSAAIKAEDDDALSIDNVIPSQTTNTSAVTISNEEFKPTINPINHLSESTEQLITELSQETNLELYSDPRLTLSQLHELNDDPDIGFLVVNTQSDYSPAVYEFSNALSTGTLIAGVTFDIILKSEGSEQIIPVTLPAGSFDQTTLSNAIDTAISNSTSTIDGSSTVIPSLVLAYNNANVITLVGYSAGDTATEFEITNFTGSSADTEELKLGLGLCTGTSCSSTAFALGQQSTGNNTHATHFGYFLNSDESPAFASYDTAATTALNNGFATPDAIYSGHTNTDITQFESLTADSDGADVDWGYWNTSATAPTTVMSNPNDLSAAETITEGFFYAEAAPAPQAELSGSKTLSCDPCAENHWHALSSTGDISAAGSASFIAELEVNFSTGQAVGSIALTDNDLNVWSLSYLGTATGAQLSSEFAYGTLTYNSGSYEAVGQVDGLFVGDSSQFGFLGGFGFNSTEIDQSAEGVFYIPE